MQLFSIRSYYWLQHTFCNSAIYAVYYDDKMFLRQIAAQNNKIISVICVIHTSSIILDKNMLWHGDFRWTRCRTQWRIQNTTHPDDKTHNTLTVESALWLHPSDTQESMIAWFIWGTSYSNRNITLTTKTISSTDSQHLNSGQRITFLPRHASVNMVHTKGIHVESK